MRKKTKIGIFIGIVFILLALGVFFGADFIAIGGAALGIIGAVFAGISGRRSGGSTAIADADRKSADVERENRAAVGSMDRVLRDGDGLRDAGAELVRNGADLVGSSKSLIDELRSADKNTATGA